MSKELKKYSLIIAYGDDLSDSDVDQQVSILMKIFLERGEIKEEDLSYHDAGWHVLAYRIRNKMKKWVLKGRYLKFNFDTSGAFVDKLPGILKNLEVDPLRFLILNNEKMNLKEDLNSILF